MKTKTIVTLALLICATITGFGQQTPAVKRLKIGDPVPGYTLSKLLNYPEQTLKLNDFKGKILILDYWNTACVSCIESWPKLLKLQEEYKDKIQIVLVNSLQDEKVILPLLKKWEKNFSRKMTLPIAYGEKMVDSLFPHAAVPHVAWIDQNVAVKYITSGSYLNAETIQHVLDGKSMQIYEKTDSYIEDINYSKPLFVDGNGGTSDNIIYSTVISKFVPGITGTAMYYSKKAYSVGVLTNASLVRMFRELYGKGIDKFGSQQLLPYARVVLKTADTASIVSYLNKIFRYENLFNIQVTVQKEISKEKIKRKMITDLELYFQVKTAWTKQKTPCLVVSRSSSPITTYRDGARALTYRDSKITVNKVTLQELINQFLSNISSWYEFPYPVVDETNYGGELGNISFETDLGNYRLVGRELEKHGLKFSIEEREVDVLVVTDDK